MGKRSFWIKPAAAVASGLLVAGLFPPFQLTAMAWVAMVPLLAVLWSIHGKRAALKGFALGWSAGTLSCLIQFNWLSEVSWLGAVALPAYLGIFWGVFGAFAATTGNPWRKPATAAADHSLLDRCVEAPRKGGWADCTSSLRTAFCHGAVWAGLEVLRGWLFTGFGWNPLGVAFHETPVIAQSADLLGVAGLSLLLVFFQAVIVQAGRRLVRSAADGKRRTRLDFAIAASVVGLLVCYGIVRMSTEGRGPSTRLKTLLVQINIPQDAAQVLWSATDVHMAYEDETLKALDQLAGDDAKRLNQSAQAANQGTITLNSPDWVMWPECALTGRLLVTGDGAWATSFDNQETISRVRAEGAFQLIYGITEMEAVPAEGDLLVPMPGGRIWNSLAVTTPENGLNTYRKNHLVIFGETIPFVESFDWLKKIYKSQAGIDYGGSFSPGGSFDPLMIPAGDGTPVGAIPSVCFEDSVPRLTRKFLRPGPQVIVNVTNDGWFLESAAAAQHFANARFRAIELRRPMIRCANTGISAAIDTTGSTTHPDTGKNQVLVNPTGSHFTRGSLLTELKIPQNPSFTLYAFIGDSGIVVLALLGWAWAWLAGKSRKPLATDAA
jgi:apolipoprotein N-acyltransferase